MRSFQGVILSGLVEKHIPLKWRQALAGRDSQSYRRASLKLPRTLLVPEALRSYPGWPCRLNHDPPEQYESPGFLVLNPGAGLQEDPIIDLESLGQPLGQVFANGSFIVLHFRDMGLADPHQVG